MWLGVGLGEKIEAKQSSLSEKKKNGAPFWQLAHQAVYPSISELPTVVFYVSIRPASIQYLNMPKLIILWILRNHLDGASFHQFIRVAIPVYFWNAHCIISCFSKLSRYWILESINACPFLSARKNHWHAPWRWWFVLAIYWSRALLFYFWIAHHISWSSRLRKGWIFEFVNPQIVVCQSRVEMLLPFQLGLIGFQSPI